MNELRKDYLLDRWVIVACDRGKRPTDFATASEGSEDKVCFFCPGNEHMTPPEISRIEEDGKWIIRVFPNKFPAVDTSAGESFKDFLEMVPVYGLHEVVAETNDHAKTLSDMPVDHLVKVFDVYMERIKELEKDPKSKYVSVFKNHKKIAGASLSHSHTQIVSIPVVPPLVKAEVEASKRYIEEHTSCPFCDIWRKEAKSERAIFEDENVVSFAPYASRFNFEAWIIPKRHVKNFNELEEEEKQSFVSALKTILERLRDGIGDPGYNFYLHYSPNGEDFHFHLELCPRIGKWAGFELATEIIINTMPPETAAKFYRGEE
ncbi:MAG: galactose-1-phosphate uridylyltransferase [Candidatus Altiarchaeota archaeon]